MVSVLSLTIFYFAFPASCPAHNSFLLKYFFIHILACFRAAKLAVILCGNGRKPQLAVVFKRALDVVSDYIPAAAVSDRIGKKFIEIKAAGLNWMDFNFRQLGLP